MTPTITRTGAPAGHQRKLRRPPSPQTPRRVSGPLSGRGGGVAVGGLRTGSASSKARRAGTPLPARALAVLRGLPDHSLIDRLVRGRAWIPVLGILLAGIVAMQVSLLKLGANIGHSLERGATLQSQNEQLRASVATLADDQRIETLAAGMGMVMPAPQAVGFLSAQPGGSGAQAVGNLKPPDPTTFLASLQTLGAASSTSAAFPASTAGVTPTSTVAAATTGAATTTANSTGAATTTVSPTASTQTAATAAATLQQTTASGATPTGTTTHVPSLSTSSSTSAQGQGTGGAPTGTGG
jgi:hypothetical protein